MLLVVLCLSLVWWLSWGCVVLLFVPRPCCCHHCWCWLAGSLSRLSEAGWHSVQHCCSVQDCCSVQNLHSVQHCCCVQDCCSHCLCFSLFRCSLLAPSEEPTNTPQPQRDFGVVPPQKLSGKEDQQTARQGFCTKKEGLAGTQPTNPSELEEGGSPEP